ncbi:DUF1996 domain-containing protein [Actinacidiphila glaucinigra]|uniref:DUF1996 domain-containing protein n=1 Tax=Actinacidiphila glaucinigra TaxID=235986 RepID=UPI0035DE47DD
MPTRQHMNHRRRLSTKQLVLIAVLALLGSGGTFALVTGSASAHWRSNSGHSGGWQSPSPGNSTKADNGGQNNGGQNNGGQNGSAAPSASASASASAPAGGGSQTNGPSREDFADIRSVKPNVQRAANQRGASRGTFTARCGRNENKHHNPDNFIVAPGVANGAHHVHDYVGNLSTDGFSTNESLAAAGTTCARGDKSTYFWPVLRTRSANDAPDADGNTGTILQATSVQLVFGGSPTSKVTAMPSTLRVIMGDAKSFTNGVANAKASWSCTGFENRQLTDKYPLCPQGSRVVRTLNFPNCWDGTNADSANHRTHIVFADGAGRCQAGFKAVPQLKMRLTYKVPQGPNFALDSFPEQLHKPVTDHADFANFMPTRLMNQVVSCINGNRNCG